MKKLFTFLLGFLAFLAISAASAFVALQVIVGGEEVVVPNLVGKDVVAAVQETQGWQLTLKLQGREASPDIPKDHIVKQMPEAGTRVKEGRAILVVLSDGTARLAVAELRGELLENARGILQRQGLEAGQIARVSDAQIAENHVMAQWPQAGQQVMRGAAVNLLVSLGPRLGTYAMPNLVGRPLEEAAAVTKALRLELADLVSVEYPGIAAGTILRHEPSGGEPVRAGMVARLVVSKKPPASAQVGTFSVLQYEMPEGLTARRVRILVASEKGSREIYNQMSEPGQQIRLLVPVHGKTSAKIYLDDKLVSERIYY